MTALNVLILSPQPPWSLGGIEKVVNETTLRIAKDKSISVEIWCKHPEKKEITWNGLKVRTFKSTLFGFSLDLIRELKKSQRRFDVIHIHGTSNFYPFEALLSLEDWEKVVVSPHYHPLGSTLLFRVVKPIYDKFIVSEFLRRAKKIVCVSETEKTGLLLKFKLPLEKLTVVYNGVSINEIKKLKNKKKNMYGKVYILYFGRLEEYKNIHILIKSMKYLPKSFVLCIVGKGSYEKELRKLVKKENLEDRVKFLGVLPKNELYSLIYSAHIVVNLSDIEAFGIAVIESLMANKPVIVNNKLGLGELSKYFPKSVIPINNPDPLNVAKLIIEVTLSKRTFKAKGLERFDWDRIAQKYRRIWIKLRGDEV